jgi:hypothetical protein
MLDMLEWLERLISGDRVSFVVGGKLDKGKIQEKRVPPREAELLAPSSPRLPAQ